MKKMQIAIDAIDQANAQDPNLETVEGKEIPKELLYAQRMTDMLSLYAPEASESIWLAARCQHICRWESPRTDYPMNREGYYAWRENLAVLHAEQAGKIMARAGYETAMIQRVQSLLKKERLKEDPEVQLLEDVICLVFLEHYFEAFSAKHRKDKLADILKKTWSKMSNQGHAAALELTLSDRCRELIGKALG